MNSIFYKKEKSKQHNHLYAPESKYTDKVSFVTKVLGKEKDAFKYYEDNNDILYGSLILEGLVRILQVKALGSQASTTSTGMNMYEFSKYKKLASKYSWNQLRNLLTRWKSYGTMHIRLGNIVLLVMIQELLLSDQLYD